MQCELIAEVSDREQFAELASGWLTDTLRSIFPEFDAGLAAGRVLGQVDRNGPPRDAPWGEPGMLWAELHVKKRPVYVGGSWVAYTPGRWQRLLKGLAEEPFSAGITITPLDAAGQPDHLRTVCVSVDRLLEAPAWVRFAFQAGSAASCVPGGGEGWAAFSRQQAEQMGACSGRIEHAGLTTALETAIGMSPSNTIPRAHEVLRGYSWVTIVAGELAQRLGGPDGLARTGAFHEMVELRHGAVWLRATPEPSDYDDAAAERVFAALAPVLIVGLAKKVYGNARPLAYGVDAANYQ